MQLLFQTGVAVIADDQMIHQLDFQKFASLHQLFGNCDILRAWRGIAAWMVVADKHSGTIACDCRAKDLGDAQHGTVHCASIEANILHNLIFCIKGQNPHLVLFGPKSLTTW
jgi:hypothetical protein